MSSCWEENTTKSIWVENSTKKELIWKEYGVRDVVYTSASFLELNDTPSSYTGQADKILAVSAGEDGIVFVDAASNVVTSIFGRTGDVVAETDDYNSNQIDNQSAVLGTNVSQALDNLDNGKLDTLIGTDGNFTVVKADGQIQDSGFTNTDFATSAQGGLADTALQPGDNVSELVNDAGYITAGDIPSDLVTSVFGRTGDVVAQANDYDASQVENDSLVTGISVADALNTLNADKLSDITGESIGDLSDVNIGGITTGQILEWDGAQFLPVDNTGGGGGAVDSVFGRTGAVIAQEGDYDIGQLGDVEIVSLVDSQFLQYNQTAGQWQNVSIAAPGAPALGELTDVTLTNEQNGEIISYNNGVWENRTESVTSVDGRTGAVTLSDLYATAAQGALADTALQPGDNVSELTNDAGYITQVADDNTPQLAGDLELNDFALTDANYGYNIEFAGDGAKIVPDAPTDTVWSVQSDPGNPFSQTTFTQFGVGIGQLSNLGGELQLTSAQFFGTKGITLDNIRWPLADGLQDQAMITNGAGELSFKTVLFPGDNVSELVNDANYVADGDVLMGGTW